MLKINIARYLCLILVLLLGVNYAFSSYDFEQYNSHPTDFSKSSIKLKFENQISDFNLEDDSFDDDNDEEFLNVAVYIAFNNLQYFKPRLLSNYSCLNNKTLKCGIWLCFRNIRI